MRANTCIESTVRFAAEFSYGVTLVKDAIGSFGAAEMDASLQFNSKYSEIVWLPVSRMASTSTNAERLTGLPNTY
jgi:nicotinamidase-related amidase